jgi:hypothetical protein
LEREKLTLLKYHSTFGVQFEGVQGITDQ